MAGIGMGGQGQGDLGEFLGDPRIQVVAVCDVKKGNLNGAKRHVDSRYQNSDCKAYGDYREVVARNDIDLILCGTPDHWHAQVSIDAMKSGKDVYCEKPLTLTIREGRKMVETAANTAGFFSCGSQRVIGTTAAWLARPQRPVRQDSGGPCRSGGPPRMCYLPVNRSRRISIGTCGWGRPLGTVQPESLFGGLWAGRPRVPDLV